LQEYYKIAADFVNLYVQANGVIEVASMRISYLTEGIFSNMNM